MITLCINELGELPMSWPWNRKHRKTLPPTSPCLVTCMQSRIISGLVHKNDIESLKREHTCSTNKCCYISDITFTELSISMNNIGRFDRFVCLSQLSLCQDTNVNTGFPGSCPTLYATDTHTHTCINGTQQHPNMQGAPVQNEEVVSRCEKRLHCTFWQFVVCRNWKECAGS